MNLIENVLHAHPCRCQSNAAYNPNGPTDGCAGERCRALREIRALESKERDWVSAAAKIAASEQRTETAEAALRERDAQLAELTKALEDLVMQVEISNGMDDHGHELKNLKALHDARQLLLPACAAESEVCYFADCLETDTFQCDSCDRWFCSDHGQKGGDRQVQDVGAVAYPSACDECRKGAAR